MTKYYTIKTDYRDSASFNGRLYLKYTPKGWFWYDRRDKKWLPWVGDANRLVKRECKPEEAAMDIFQ